MTTPLEQLTRDLARLATHYDMLGAWPATSIDRLEEAGAWTWIIPKQYGGMALGPADQITAYEAVAAGCMSSLLILTQRDGACELIAASDNESLKAELLPKLARNEIMTSVGISQITTSRQGGKPALTATPEGANYRLHGFMPWVTGAAKCDFLVTGAVLPDGRRILAAVPTDAMGVQIDPPMKLMALEASQTSEVHCRKVLLSEHHILQGPADRVLARRSAVKPLVVAAAGVGLAGAMVLTMVERAAGLKGRLGEIAEDLVARYEAVRERLYKHARQLVEPGAEIPRDEIRVAVNDLLMRLAVATLTYAKGSGFIRQRDAQRLAREAMFFLVWSATEEVRIQTLEAFLHTPPPESKSMSC
ncbi:MAG: acyl-CoA dehydrogenase family protein [Phycisphaerae bacterium]